MCSNNTAFSNEFGVGANRIRNNTNTKKQEEHTYYAKLINVNQRNEERAAIMNRTDILVGVQRRNGVRNSHTAYPTGHRRLTDNYLNAKLAEYLNEADYEALMNFDSVLNTVAVPKVVESSPSSSTVSVYSSISKSNKDTDQLNYSNEDEDFNKYYELEKFHSSLKKNIQKSNTPPELSKISKISQYNLVTNPIKRLDSTSVGSFSSSSASSISSQSSVANSSTTSSSSSSPLLSANFLNENSAAIYSTNYKIRNRTDELNQANFSHRIIENSNSNDNIQCRTNSTRIQGTSPVPAPPSSQPPSLTPKNADIKLIKSHSAIITKTTMSAWLHPTAKSTGQQNNYDDCNSCLYSDLNDPVGFQSLEKGTLELLSKKTSNSKLLKQYDSSLLTPLKPKHTAYSTRTVTSPIRSNSSVNIKSASTSYLLSKITSIGSNTKNSPPLPVAQPANTLTNLANKTTKFFQGRKSLNQQGFNQHYDEVSSISASSPIEEKLLASASSTSSSSVSVTSSRRAFIKKRSQSSHINIAKSQIWTFNKDLNIWILMNRIISENSNSKTDFISSTLRKTKRKSNKLNDQLNANIISSEEISRDNMLNKIRLNQIELKYLTQVELKYLKQICFNKLKSELENIEIAIPKDESLKCTKTKNIAIRSKSVDFKFFDEFKENYFSKKSVPHQQVFGQSLYKCILNDLQRFKTNNNKTSNTNNPGYNSVNSNTITRRWRSSHQNKVLIASKFDLNLLQNKNHKLAQKQEDSVNNKRNSVLFEALDLKNVKKNNLTRTTPILGGGHKPRLSSSRNRLANNNSQSILSINKDNDSEGQPTSLNQNLSVRSEGLVPNIVKSCCNHIIEYGLDVVGIFRIDSSKKRIKDIKEMYETGKEVIMNEEFNPNDSACILKEYLRSLPEPLLTRDLYSCFLSISKIKDVKKKLGAIRLLICLLPVPNRDTLQILLHLLDKVRANACTDPSRTTPEKSGSTDFTGNKMDSFNLAMVFGPNLLKKHCGNGNVSSRVISNSKINDYSSDLIDDIDSVISVTKFLIENQNEIFHIDSSLHNELIETINNINPIELNSILTRKQISAIGVTPMNEISPQSSNEYLNITPTPSGSHSLVSSPHSIQFSTNTSCSSSDSSNSHRIPNSSSQYSQNSTPELQQNKRNAKFLNYLNADFIDNNIIKQFTRQKNSKTKLHKIVDNFNYLNCADQNQVVVNKPIHFINSPNHSPINNKISSTKKSSVRQLKKHSVESSNQTSLLMIQDQNIRPNNNNVNSKIESLEKMCSGNNKKTSTKSMSNLSEISNRIIIKNSNESQTMRRQSSSNLKNQYKTDNSMNSNTIHKFYDKTKYNIIGEQETLV